jgi:KipI family sensor histidine kinase inhibitor
MRVRRVGLHALLAEVPDAESAAAVYAQARRRRMDALEVVPAARSVLFDGVADPAALAAELKSWSPGTPADGDAGSPGPEHDLVEVATVYDGADLAEVARRWGMTRSEAVATHARTDFQVAFCGFAPGFAYCVGLPPALHLPRLDTPRSRVPAGSVGLAGEFTGVYPTESPGGWRLIGRTELRLWDAEASPPALLPPGARVRFVPA